MVMDQRSVLCDSWNKRVRYASELNDRSDLYMKNMYTYIYRDREGERETAKRILATLAAASDRRMLLKELSQYSALKNFHMILCMAVSMGSQSWCDENTQAHDIHVYLNHFV